MTRRERVAREMHIRECSGKFSQWDYDLYDELQDALEVVNQARKYLEVYKLQKNIIKATHALRAAVLQYEAGQ